MLSQGTPYIYSGEELLREKLKDGYPQSGSEGGGDDGKAFVQLYPYKIY